jgi:starch-binding outer membrane protein, SusD/RagB family
MSTMKNMIRIKLFALVLLVGGTFSSCGDWLYLEPESGIISESYWQSEQDLKAGTMGIYASMLGNTESGSFSVAELMWLWGEVRADMISSFGLIMISIV